MKFRVQRHQPLSSPSAFVYVPIVLLVLGHLTTAEIAVISEKNETVAVFFDVELGLGAALPSGGVVANVVLAQPDDACAPIQKAPVTPENSTVKWFVLSKRFPCSFATKMRNAVAAGFDGIIVYNIESNARKNISFSHFPGINAFDVFLGSGNVPAVLISNDDGVALRSTYLYDRGYYILITPDFGQNLLSYLLPFAVVIGICLIIMISFMVVKCVRDRRKSRRHRLSSKHLKKLPTTKFKKGDHYDTCAICLDEYVDGEKLRVLPCGHVYHMKCIDPWLTKNRRVCPVCKGKVVLPGMTDPTDSESEAENAAVSERTPLVPNARPSRWRRVRRQQRAPTVSVVDAPAQAAEQSLASGPAATEQEQMAGTSTSTDVNFPVTSALFSVNYEESERGGVDVPQPSSSSMVAVVDVEPMDRAVASSAPPARRTSRRSRRNDAIV